MTSWTSVTCDPNGIARITIVAVGTAPWVNLGYSGTTGLISVIPTDGLGINATLEIILQGTIGQNLGVWTIIARNYQDPCHLNVQYPLEYIVSLNCTSSSPTPTPTPTPVCVDASQCGDNNLCTTDTCVNGQCVHTAPTEPVCTETCTPGPMRDVCGDGCWNVPHCGEANCDCIGSCTYTQGYWKTHNAHRTCNGNGPCQQTVAWPAFAGLTGDMEDVIVCDALLAVQALDTLHCLNASDCESPDSGNCVGTLLDLMGQPPASNYWLQLLHQWIAYHLNTAEERNPCPSCVVPELQNADAIATKLLLQYCESGFVSGEYPNELASEIQDILTAYNEGEIGPGHCEPTVPVFCTEQPDCGCTYTRGYWQSPRFRTYPYNSKKVGTDTVKDTCAWPINSTDHVEDDTLNCPPISGVKKWDLIHGTFKGKVISSNKINPQWMSTMAQAIAFELNLLNGACAVGCVHSDFISGQCADVQTFFQLDVYPFIQSNGQICTVTLNTPIGACTDACQRLCDQLLPTGPTTCNMYDVLEAFNNGSSGIGPGHCESTPDGDPTRRGCCENCNCYQPACDPQIIALQSETTTATSDSDNLTLDEELDITLVVLSSLILIGIIILLFLLCQKGRNFFSNAMAKVDYTGTKSEVRQNIRGQQYRVLL